MNRALYLPYDYTENPQAAVADPKHLKKLNSLFKKTLTLWMARVKDQLLEPSGY